MQLLDGKLISDQIKSEIAKEVLNDFINKGRTTPHLAAVLVGDDPASTIPKLAKYIKHYHLEDIANTRVHHHLIPGDGAIDFKAAIEAIKATGYKEWVTIELYPYVEDPDQAAKLARERIAPLLA